MSEERSSVSLGAQLSADLKATLELEKRAETLEEKMAVIQARSAVLSAWIAWDGTKTDVYF